MEELNKVEIEDAEHCKNLFTRNRKGDVHYLVIVEDCKRVDLKSLSEQIGEYVFELCFRREAV